MAQVKYKSPKCLRWYGEMGPRDHYCNRFLTGFILRRICITINSPIAIKQLKNGNKLHFFVQYNKTYDYKSALLGKMNNKIMGPFIGTQ